MLQYRLSEQWHDIYKALLASALTAGCACGVLWLGMGVIPTLLVQAVVSVVMYFYFSKWLKNTSAIDYVMALVGKIRRGKK